MNILVSMRIVDNATYPERRDSLSHDWATFFNEYDLVPILVLNALANPGRYFDMAPRGVLLTGGDSIGPRDQPTQRDRTEMCLIDEAIARKIPIFGVCRGLHLLNRYFGGETVDLPKKSHVGTHSIQLAGDISLTVNSFHNEGVTKATLATELLPFAFSEDGVIEAVRHVSLPIIAIQWHPERLNSASTLDKQLLEEWKNRCALSS